MLLSLKEGGVSDFEESYNGFSANISHQVMLYYEHFLVLRYNKWKASANTHNLYDWKKDFKFYLSIYILPFGGLYQNIP